ncbi:hypothetical protein N866_12265 [Actinotalea ferrariae CF5-4]|uniref:DUF2231 domain-containing protein n=1 Tax=Actinotalea ferrariae CF5-4 TaxID=948458 RepID=A0A021VT31_9CELL|nr:DUF2231 domain-containing protein [Actinotalea ferrariae]EYR64339.1 hypothetical protein N866_12265 [Actinotalea ferrariae CF5-4]
MTTLPPPADDAFEQARSRFRTDQPALVGLALRLEEDGRLDPAVDALRPAADALVARRPVRDALLGRVMGHSLHPILTDLPIGAWVSALTLDLVGGRQSRPAARRLVGVGILAAVPTAVSGLADWQHVGRRDQRVGVVHAAGNSLGLLLFGASWVARGRGHHGRGVALGLLGGAAAGFSGFLGGHLSLARNVAARDEAFADSLPVSAADRTGQELTS